MFGAPFYFRNFLFGAAATGSLALVSYCSVTFFTGGLAGHVGPIRARGRRAPPAIQPEDACCEHCRLQAEAATAQPPHTAARPDPAKGHPQLNHDRVPYHMSLTGAHA
eukprot:EG_transcript_30485